VNDALAPVRVTAPAEPLLSLADARAHLRVTSNDEDALITSLCAAAEAHLDGYSGVLGRALVTQTWKRSFCRFEYPGMRLPLGVAQTVESITYYDLNDTIQTVDPATYYLVEDAQGPLVNVKATASWPASYYRDDAVTVEWTCGYGATTAVPQAIKQAALLLISGWFDNRSSVIDNNKAIEMPLAVRALLRPFSTNL
jgi:uncharacterized phiE125 gp8 family phage protein